MLTTLVRTIDCATSSFLPEHVHTCLSMLAHTLEAAGFEHVNATAERALGHALECDRDGVHHVVLPLILTPDRYDLNAMDLESLVSGLLEASDADDSDIADAIASAALDVASVCLDVIEGRCRIHHSQDVLHEHQLAYEPQHFFIPAESTEPVDAAVCPPELMRSPLALSQLVGA